MKPIHPSPGSKVLTKRAARLIAASMSPNTIRNYTSALRAFESWRKGKSVNDALCADYVAALNEQGVTKSSAATFAAAMNRWTKVQGANSPIGELTREALAGYSRSREERGRGQVRGIQWQDADLVAHIAENDGTLAGLRDAAIVAVMSDGLLRVSELAAIQVWNFNFEIDGSARLTIQWSKTDQEGSGVVLFMGLPTANRVRQYAETAGIDSGSLFRRIRRGGKITECPLSPEAVRNIIKTRATNAGIKGRVSGHSFRIGSAESLIRAGGSLVDLQTQGRWKSPSMPAHYARGELAGRGAVARLRYHVS